MNIGAFLEGLKGGSKKQETDVERLLAQQVKEFESRAAKVKILSKTAGWKEFDKFMTERVELLRRKRDDDVAGTPDDLATQAAIRAYQDIQTFIHNLSQ